MDKEDNPTPDLRQDLGWNNDPDWVTFVDSLSGVIKSIAAKYTEDLDLRQDAVQNAKIELLQKYPEEVRGYEQFSLGKITFGRWQEILRSYCLTVCRNEILSTLSSHSTGNLYIGRTHVTRVTHSDGTKSKIRTHVPARFISLDLLREDSGLQVSDRGELSWNSLHEVIIDGDE